MIFYDARSILSTFSEDSHGLLLRGFRRALHAELIRALRNLAGTLVVSEGSARSYDPDENFRVLELHIVRLAMRLKTLKGSADGET
jgi:hypothetical protein